MFLVATMCGFGRKADGNLIFNKHFLSARKRNFSLIKFSWIIVTVKLSFIENTLNIAYYYVDNQPKMRLGLGAEGEYRGAFKISPWKLWLNVRVGLYSPIIFESYLG